MIRDREYTKLEILKMYFKTFAKAFCIISALIVSANIPAWFMATERPVIGIISTILVVAIWVSALITHDKIR